MTRSGAQALPRPVLAVIALGAALLHQLLILLPIALALFLPVLWYRSSFLAGAALLGFAILAWLVQPSDAREQQTLERDEAPELFHRVDALCARLGSPRVHAIVLDQRLNAGAWERHRGVSLRPTRRVLLLGLPLLALLDDEEVDAVLAHELGHFSRRHGRLGHWLYRVQAAWAGHLDRVHERDSAAWERAGQAFAEWFVPWFGRLAFAHSRRCEFEADALAADVVNAAALGRALWRIDLLHLRWLQCADGALQDLQRQHAQPPAEGHRAWLPQLLAPRTASADEKQRLLADIDAGSTHPPTVERLRALGLDPDALASLPGPGQLRPALQVQAAEPAWPARVQAGWPLQHAALQVLQQRWQALQAGPATAERLRLAWTLHQSAAAIADGLALKPATDVAVDFFRCSAQLRSGVEADAALAGLRRCIAQDPVWAVPARLQIADLPAGGPLTPAEREQNEALLQRGLERRAEALDKLARAVERAELGPPAIDETQRAALQAALAAGPPLHEAWFAAAEVELPGARRFRAHVMVVRVDPLVMGSAGLEEPVLAAALRDLLARVFGPPGLVFCASSFSTEPADPRLQARLASLPGARLR